MDCKKMDTHLKKVWEQSQNRYGETVTFKRYYLNDIVSENMEHIPSID